MGISTTLLISILSLFAMAGADFFTTSVIFKNNFRSLRDVSFANCWVVIGLMHLLMGVRTTFFGLEMPEFDKALAYVVQFLVVFVVVAVGYYVMVVSFKSRIVRFFFGIMIFFVAVSFLGLFVKFGLTAPVVSAWGSEYSAAWQANIVLMFGVFVSLGLLLYSIIKLFIRRKKENNTKRLFANLSLFLYLSFSIFEQLGNAGWDILLVRILILVSILMAYTTYDLEKYKFS